MNSSCSTAGRAARSLLGGVLLLLSSTTTARAQNLVLNPGFETGDFSNWTLVRALDIHAVPAGYTLPPHSGTYHAQLPYWGPTFDCDAACQEAGSWSSISQMIVTNPGHIYEVAFWAQTLAFGLPGHEINAYFGQNQMITWLYQGDEYHRYVDGLMDGSLFQAEGEMTELRIQWKEAFNAPFWLDDISVIDHGPYYEGYVDEGPWEAPTPTPEPASLVLLATGMLGVAAAVRRRKRA